MKFGYLLPLLLAGRAAADDIMDILRGGDFPTLVAALDASGLDRFLESSWWCERWGWGCRDYTVFAPTEDAFAALPNATLDRLLTKDFLPHLKDLLSYHTLKGAVASGDIEDGAVLGTLNGENITADVDGEDITLNSVAAVTIADTKASNGVVHVVDAVLTPSSTQNIAQVAELNELNRLVALLGQVGLDSFVSDPDKTLTVFAPTDEAFQALIDGGFDASDNAAVEELLKYHVVDGDVLTKRELLHAPGPLFTVQGSAIDVGTSGHGWWKDLALNGDVGVEVADVLASNGVVHVVNTVLSLPDPLGDIPTVASGNADFSTLVAALVKAELVETLQGEGPFTVFAPTNEAFTKAGIDIDELTPEELEPILLYHVLAGEQLLEDDIASGVVQTNPATPTNLLVDVHKGWRWSWISLNGNVHVTDTDILASNGVIHAIDDVLVPPKNIVDLASEVSELSTLVRVLGEAGLVAALSEPGPFTVFAPDNDAFAALDAIPDGDDLSNVLLYHVVEGNAPSSALEDGEVETLLTQSVKVDVRRSWWRGGVFLTGAKNDDEAKVTGKDIVAANGIVHVIDGVLLPTLDGDIVSVN